MDGLGRRSNFTCPECSGALWEIEEGKHLHYRCHVGHAYSADVLGDAQQSTIEHSLWSATRALKESAALDERLAERSEQHGLDATAKIHRANASQKLVQAQQVQSFLASLRPTGEGWPEPRRAASRDDGRG